MASLSSHPRDPPVTVTEPKKPSQIKFFRSVQMAIFARITSYPPLGQVTVVPPSRKQFNFTVVVESSQSLPDRPWEVSIWYDHGTYSQSTAPWRALDLEKVATGPTVLFDNREKDVYRYTFEGNLPSPFPDNGKTYKGRKIPFTVRYRIDSDSEWQWVADNFGTPDGNVILQPPVDPNFLGAGPVELRDGWAARKLNSEAAGARLYMAETSSPFPPNSEGESKTECRTVGHVISPCRWFALVRIWEPWVAPRHGREYLRLDKPAVLLAFLRSDGQHVVLLAINGIDDCLTTFSSDEHGQIVCCIKNDTGKDRKMRFLTSVAWDVEIATAAVMYEMRKMVVQSSSFQEMLSSVGDLQLSVPNGSHGPETALVSDNAHDQAKRDANNDSKSTAQWLEAWYDSLAYCTWNSLGQDLNADKIMKGLQSLADNDIQIATLIIDDNWQSLTGKQGETSQFERGWTDFEANSVGFPEGLKKAVDKIREAHPRIRDIAVWHALFGYWGCVSAEQGHIKDDYKLREVTVHTQMFGYRQKHVVDVSDVHKMYDDFYAFLSKSGITSVKTDAQFFLDLLSDTNDRRDLITPYQSAWTQAHLKHFSAKAISCMSQIPQILYHSFLPTMTPRVLLRNSDDFFPDVDKSHPWHVFTNAHAACFVQHLNVLPDWDMFQTAHPWAGFHAAARCISGGPIYITDTPGEHNVDLIHQMTAKSPRGETIILRPSTIAKTVDVYNGYEEGSPLQIGSYDGKSDVGTGILGVFNIWEAERSFMVPVNKFPGIEAIDLAEGSEGERQQVGKRKWVVRSHMSKTITGPIVPTIPPRGDGLLECILPVRGYDIWSSLPVHGPYAISSGSVEVAVIGLLGKMTGACAIVETSFEVLGNGDALSVKIQLKALGTLGIWISDGASRKVDDLKAFLGNKAISQEKVKVESAGVTSENAAIVEIDFESAWKEMGLYQKSEENTATVEVLFS